MNPLRLMVDNWWSRAYLIGVALVALWVALTFVRTDPGDANLSPALLILVTLPGSLVMVLIPHAWDDNAALLLVAVAFGALLNAVLIGAVVRGVRRLVRPGR